MANFDFDAYETSQWQEPLDRAAIKGDESFMDVVKDSFDTASKSILERSIYEKAVLARIGAENPDKTITPKIAKEQYDIDIADSVSAAEAIAMQEMKQSKVKAFEQSAQFLDWKRPLDALTSFATMGAIYALTPTSLALTRLMGSLGGGFGTASGILYNTGRGFKAFHSISKTIQKTQAARIASRSTEYIQNSKFLKNAAQVGSANVVEELMIAKAESDKGYKYDPTLNVTMGILAPAVIGGIGLTMVKGAKATSKTVSKVAKELKDNINIKSKNDIDPPIIHEPKPTSQAGQPKTPDELKSSDSDIIKPANKDDDFFDELEFPYPDRLDDFFDELEFPPTKETTPKTKGAVRKDTGEIDEVGETPVTYIGKYNSNYSPSAAYFLLRNATKDRSMTFTREEFDFLKQRAYGHANLKGQKTFLDNLENEPTAKKGQDRDKQRKNRIDVKRQITPTPAKTEPISSKPLGDTIDSTRAEPVSNVSQKETVSNISQRQYKLKPLDEATKEHNIKQLNYLGNIIRKSWDEFQAVPYSPRRTILFYNAVQDGLEQSAINKSSKLYKIQQLLEQKTPAARKLIETIQKEINDLDKIHTNFYKKISKELEPDIQQYRDILANVKELDADQNAYRIIINEANEKLNHYTELIQNNRPLKGIESEPEELQSLMYNLRAVEKKFNGSIDKFKELNGHLISLGYSPSSIRKMFPFLENKELIKDLQDPFKITPEQIDDILKVKQGTIDEGKPTPLESLGTDELKLNDINGEELKGILADLKLALQEYRKCRTGRLAIKTEGGE